MEAVENRAMDGHRRWGAPALALWAALALLGASASSSSAAAAQGSTSFTYEGRIGSPDRPLDTGGQAGPYDFEFRLFDQAQAGQGAQIGETVERPGLPIRDGQFRAELDFGPEFLERPESWLEIRVFLNEGGARKLLLDSRQALSPRPRQAAAPSLPPATSDAEVLGRLGAVKVVISDRATPGQPHFIVDEGTFRRAFGLGTPVTTLDVASVGIVAASQLTREVQADRERIASLESELSSLRFRSNLTLLLLAVVVVTLLIQRRGAGASGPEATGGDGQEEGPERETAEEPESPREEEPMEEAPAEVGATGASATPGPEAPGEPRPGLEPTPER